MSKHKGVPATHQRAGGYTIKRHLSSATYTFGTPIDLRTDQWFGACPQLSTEEKIAAKARGEAKKVLVRLVSGTVFKTADEASPGDRYNSADATVPIVESTYSNRNAPYLLNWDSASGNVVLEVEIEFDIPTADEVA